MMLDIKSHWLTPDDYWLLIGSSLKVNLSCSEIWVLMNPDTMRSLLVAYSNKSHEMGSIGEKPKIGSILINQLEEISNAHEIIKSVGSIELAIEKAKQTNAEPLNSALKIVQECLETKYRLLAPVARR